LYEYTFNDPVNFVDPEGLFTPIIVPVEILPNPNPPGHSKPSDLEKGIRFFGSDTPTKEDKDREFDKFWKNINDPDNDDNPYNHSKTCPIL
jgi:hypothetical protein